MSMTYREPDDGDVPEENENALQREQRAKRKEDELRARGKPTLHVSLGDLLRQHLEKKS